MENLIRRHDLSKYTAEEDLFKYGKMRQVFFLHLMESVQKGEKDGDKVDKKLEKEYFDRYVSPNLDNSK